MKGSPNRGDDRRAGASRMSEEADDQLAAEGRVKYPITIQDYVRVLRAVGAGEAAQFRDLDGIERRVAAELLKSGLISDLRAELGRGRHVRRPFAITPEGLSALASWEAYLEESSLKHKAKVALGRFGWIMVGALVTSATAVLLGIA